MAEPRLITVCDECHRACCWQGTFMCDEARNAGTINLPLSELQQMALEHPDYWKGATQFGGCRHDSPEGRAARKTWAKMLAAAPVAGKGEGG